MQEIAAGSFSSLFISLFSINMHRLDCKKRNWNLVGFVTQFLHFLALYTDLPMKFGTLFFSALVAANSSSLRCLQYILLPEPCVLPIQIFYQDEQSFLFLFPLIFIQFLWHQPYLWNALPPILSKVYYLLSYASLLN